MAGANAAAEPASRVAMVSFIIVGRVRWRKDRLRTMEIMSSTAHKYCLVEHESLLGHVLIPEWILSHRFFSLAGRIAGNVAYDRISIVLYVCTPVTQHNIANPWGHYLTSQRQKWSNFAEMEKLLCHNNITFQRNRSIFDDLKCPPMDLQCVWEYKLTTVSYNTSFKHEASLTSRRRKEQQSRFSPLCHLHSVPTRSKITTAR